MFPFIASLQPFIEKRAREEQKYQCMHGALHHPHQHTYLNPVLLTLAAIPLIKSLDFFRRCTMTLAVLEYGDEVTRSSTAPPPRLKNKPPEREQMRGGGC